MTGGTAVLLHTGATVILLHAHIAAVLPDSDEVLMSCGVVYKINRLGMDFLLESVWGTKRTEKREPRGPRADDQA